MCCPLQAFESLLQLFEARATYEEFCVPMCMVPATISNNVPGTNLSIGADTALNAIVEVREPQLAAVSRELLKADVQRRSTALAFARPRHCRPHIASS